MNDFDLSEDDEIYSVQSYEFSKLAMVKVADGYKLTEDLEVGLNLSFGHHNMVDTFHFTIHKGFTISGSPFPSFMGLLFPECGSKDYNCASFLLAGLYAGSGFNAFGRSQCDKIYMDIIRMITKNHAVRILRDLIGGVFVGCTYQWNYNTYLTPCELVTMAPED
ncbi:MAG: hypothetical protein MJZ25_03950 [Fibrobacter sp.]|nr:hypothetical protein [Fibrobacter sp.]